MIGLYLCESAEQNKKIGFFKYLINILFFAQSSGGGGGVSSSLSSPSAAD